MKAIFHIAIQVFLLSGCISVPYQNNEIPQVISDQYGVNKEGIVFSSVVNFALTDKSTKCSNFINGAYIQTRELISLYPYNTKNKAFSKPINIPLDSLIRANIYSSGLNGYMKQLRLETDEHAIPIAFSREKSMVASFGEHTKSAIEALEKSGLSIGDTNKIITSHGACNFVMPVIIYH